MLQIFKFTAQSRLLKNIADLLPAELQSPYTLEAIALVLIILLSTIVHLIIRFWIIKLLIKLDESGTR